MCDRETIIEILSFFNSHYDYDSDKLFILNTPGVVKLSKDNNFTYFEDD